MQRQQQMVQTFSWARFNNPIDINGGKCEGTIRWKNILVPT